MYSPQCAAQRAHQALPQERDVVVRVWFKVAALSVLRGSAPRSAGGAAQQLVVPAHKCLPREDRVIQRSEGPDLGRGC